MPVPGTDLRLTIVGTGAMACLFGARLAAAAHVTFTGSWAAGIEAIRQHGVVLEEPQERRAIPAQAVPWNQAVEPADLVLILVKSWRSAEVALHLPRLLKPQGVALTLQNGLGNLEALGPRACLGVTYLGAMLLGPGHVQAGGDGATVIAGPEWLVPLFRRAGLETESGDPGKVDGLLWGKLATNCGINALTAILRVPNGELLRRPDATVLMKQAAVECAAVAAAKGVSLPFADPAEKVCAVARMTAHNHSSMLQDVLRGAPTECEAINGSVVRWGSFAGVPTPVNEVLLRLVRALTIPAPAAPGNGSASR